MQSDDEVSRMIQRLNQEKNGTGPPMAPPGIKPRPSGWVCPRCGQAADQRIDVAPGTILGYQPMRLADTTGGLLPEDDRPSPVSVFCPEIMERDEEGRPTKSYLTIHCLNCFNAWQRRKMMEDIRANVPQLEYKPNDSEPT